ncbi:MAG: hypothetical protein ACOXZS_03670 [Bacilli bacterium]
MKKYLRIMIIPLLAIIIGIAIYWFFLDDQSANKEPKIKPPKIINEIKEYGYKLDENQTPYYKSLFEDLKTELSKEEIDEQKYAELVAKMFIADFYTLENKVTKNDIGGTIFIYSKYRDNFIAKAKDTIYKYVENNIYGDRTQELPNVKEIEVLTIKPKTYTYSDKTKDSKAYEITLKWSYEVDLGYETETKMTIVHEDNKLVIAEID